MPIVKTFVPDSAPSEHPRASPNAASTNLPADAPVWAAAQRSYVEDGCSSSVVAKRHGLVARTVRDHAQKEDWAGLRAAHRAAVRHLEDALAPDDPEEAILAESRARRVLDLVTAPSSAVAQAFAAHEIQNAMARGVPQEARQWRRVFADLRRDDEALDRAFRGGLSVSDRARLAPQDHAP